MNNVMAVLLSLQIGVAGVVCDVASQQLLPIFRGLFAVSHTAARETERALFVTRDAQGVLGFALWPATMQRRKASYRGAVPANTIAIAHTHPSGMPKPSQHDLDEAARTGLPIYVVTRTSIARANPDHTTTDLVARTDWYGQAARLGTGLCSATEAATLIAAMIR